MLRLLVLSVAAAPLAPADQSIAINDHGPAGSRGRDAQPGPGRVRGT